MHPRLNLIDQMILALTLNFITGAVVLNTLHSKGQVLPHSPVTIQIIG